MTNRGGRAAYTAAAGIAFLLLACDGRDSREARETKAGSEEADSGFLIPPPPARETSKGEDAWMIPPPPKKETPAQPTPPVVGTGPAGQAKKAVEGADKKAEPKGKEALEKPKTETKPQAAAGAAPAPSAPAKTEAGPVTEKKEKQEARQPQPAAKAKPPTAAKKTPPGYRDIPSQKAKCSADPKKCVTFGDGYKARLAEGDTIGKRTTAKGKWEGKEVEIARGKKRNYYHPKGTTFLKTEPAAQGSPEDCVAYTPKRLRLEEREGGIVLTDGVSRLLSLADKTDGRKAMAVARKHSMLCFIGRKDPGTSQGEHIVQYWK